MISLKSPRVQHNVRGIRYFMRNTKKTVIIIICLVVFYATLRKIYRFLFHHESAYFSAPAASLVSLTQEALPSTPSGEYNYQRTLALVEQTQVLSKSFYAQFTGKHSKNKVIDVKQAKALLADLYREKVRLNRYMIETKLRYKGNVPLKISNIVTYHKKVVEKCAQDVAEILRKA